MLYTLSAPIPHQHSRQCLPVQSPIVNKSHTKAKKKPCSDKRFAFLSHVQLYTEARISYITKYLLVVDIDQHTAISILFSLVNKPSKCLFSKVSLLQKTCTVQNYMYSHLATKGTNRKNTNNPRNGKVIVRETQGPG